MVLDDPPAPCSALTPCSRRGPALHPQPGGSRRPARERLRVPLRQAGLSHHPAQGATGGGGGQGGGRLEARVGVQRNEGAGGARGHAGAGGRRGGRGPGGRREGASQGDVQCESLHHCDTAMHCTSVTAPLRMLTKLPCTADEKVMTC